MFSSKLLIFALLWFTCVKCEICDLADNECLTASSNVKYKPFIQGSNCESSDPLHVDVIEANLEMMKYKLENATLSGMVNCHAHLVSIHTETATFDFTIACPHLIIESEYEIKGKLGPHPIEGTGTCRLDAYNYFIIFQGEYEIITDANGVAHIKIKTYKVDFDCKGKVEYDFKNLFNGNEELSQAVHKFANENWSYIDKLTRQSGLAPFMKKYVLNLNTCMNVVPISDLFKKP